MIVVYIGEEKDLLIPMTCDDVRDAMKDMLSNMAWYTNSDIWVSSFAIKVEPKLDVYGI